MATRISIIIPVYNGAETLGRCLEAAGTPSSEEHEVIVVDDCSKDGSAEIAEKYPCRVIRLPEKAGASKARNEGARQSSGEILFFIDADCIIQPGTLAAIDSAMKNDKGTVLGGTYTPLPYDKDFFSAFQSVFINYSETRQVYPDYIAAHAMAIERDLFLKHGGFPEVFLPIIEDVEFCHRLRRAGVVLKMNPAILVTHIFRFSLPKSLKNAFRKAHYWTIYSLGNKDLAKDSGTASAELKLNVISWPVVMSLLLAWSVWQTGLPLYLASVVTSINLLKSRGLLHAMFRAKGAGFGLMAALYYCLVYPLPVGLGGLAGLIKYITGQKADK